MNGIYDRASGRKHFIECGRGQDLIGHIQELLGQSTLQARHNLVQIQLLIVIDQGVAHLAQYAIPIEEIVQLQLEFLELYSHGHLGELDVLQTMSQVACAAHLDRRLGIIWNWKSKIQLGYLQGIWLNAPQ